jgi:hypothetical protein
MVRATVDNPRAHGATAASVALCVEVWHSGWTLPTAMAHPATYIHTYPAAHSRQRALQRLASGSVAARDPACRQRAIWEAGGVDAREAHRAPQRDTLRRGCQLLGRGLLLHHRVALGNTVCAPTTTIQLSATNHLQARSTPPSRLPIPPPIAVIPRFFALLCSRPAGAHIRR